MKPLLPNSSLSKQNSVTLVEDGKVLTDPSEVVEVFNNYFASVAVHETHRGRVENFSDAPFAICHIYIVTNTQDSVWEGLEIGLY